MFVCLSRLSPLRVGCLRLAPIGTRFCCPAAPISGQPVCECILLTALDVVQTAGLEPAHTSWRGALPTELRLRMSPLGHIVERREGSYAQPELHRGVKGKYQLPETSCFCGPQLIYSWSTGRDASPENVPCHCADGGACTSHSLTVSVSTALLGGTRTVICSVYLFRHVCI